MRVVLIYRHPQPGDYSIEELFHTIAEELGNYVEVIEYQAGTRWKTLTDIWQLRKLKADIYHVTGDINYFAFLLPHKRTVLTVHDIGNYLFGLRGLKRWLYGWIWFWLPLRAAHAITAGSADTRDHIVRHFRILNEKIQVINNCFSARLKPISRPFQSELPVILQVGTKPYKNVPRLVDALQGIRCQLVLIGRLDRALTAQLNDKHIDYVNRFDLSQEEIVRQYADCDLVSFVSVGEGFGVPIIEAQATGRPLITSCISPLCDVAGDGACLVDPLDAEQIRHGIMKIISDPEYRETLIENGFRNVVRYSSTSVSRQYIDLYRRVLPC
jgi:glycosyltransferase involved in cell wall biosynthesis